MRDLAVIAYALWSACGAQEGSNDVPGSTCYQVVVIAPHQAKRATTLNATLRAECRILGLAATVVRFLDERSFVNIDPALPVTGVYFGGSAPTADAITAVEHLCSEDVTILPVVSTFNDYTKQVPTPLHALNGLELNPEDSRLAAVANHVLEQFGLVQRERMAFISYRRSDTRRTALQIYQGLDARSWGVFLDTHSISAGVNFQETLWDQMASADVLILLDSPGVLKSRWVQEEIARAHDLGMGVLQLIWPSHVRTPGTEFCEAEYLDASDFVGSASRDGGASLRSKALQRILASVEGIRAKAVAARRYRLVREFCASAVASGKAVLLQPRGELEVSGLRSGNHCMVPVIGHPSSEHFHQVHDRAKAERKQLMVLYDAAGSHSRRVRHLRWLDRHLPSHALPVHESYRWLRGA